MLFKYFTDKDSKKSIAVNPNNVKYVIDSGYGPIIVFVGGVTVTVSENYLEVVAQLSVE
jgi:hypothetical protein